MSTKVFKNTIAHKWDGETTQLVACVAETPPNGAWVECDESILSNLMQLYIQAGRIYYGRL